MKILCLMVFTLALICGIAAYEKFCPDKCPMAYDLVCGLNGNCYQIFRNLCFMQTENCEIKQTFQEVELSECSRDDAPKCKLESTLSHCSQKIQDFFLVPGTIKSE